jgi:hypothetical protein
VSFWVPGFFGSLAATPQHPGFSWATTLGPIPFTVSGGRTVSVTAFGDVAPQFAQRWNVGVHNCATAGQPFLTEERVTRCTHAALAHTR